MRRRVRLRVQEFARLQLPLHRFATARCGPAHAYRSSLDHAAPWRRLHRRLRRAHRRHLGRPMDTAALPVREMSAERVILSAGALGDALLAAAQPPCPRRAARRAGHAVLRKRRLAVVRYEYAPARQGRRGGGGGGGVDHGAETRSVISSTIRVDDTGRAPTAPGTTSRRAATPPSRAGWPSRSTCPARSIA